jgi:uncharacterized membrane protein YozB (DUF420 family)
MQFLIDSRLASNINLLAQIAMLVALYVGYYYAKKKKFRPQHANIQTTVVIVNLFFILLIMAVTFYQFVSSGPDVAEHPGPFIVIHVILGIVAEILGIYLVLRMRTKIIPPALKVKNFKLLMQMTLGLWTAAVLFGLIVYASYYLGLGA